MNKPLCVISCPIDVYSGYSSRSRDIVKSIIQLKKDVWDIKILSMPWGNCPFGFIDENPEWQFLNEYILQIPQVDKQPDIWIQITIPSEFNRQGKFNIGISAITETTIAPSDFIEGVNRMDLTLVSSKHSKDILINSKFQKVNNQTKQVEGIVELNRPVEILFEGFSEEIFKYIENPNKQIGNLDTIPESFNYLFVGHWIGINSPIGEDRKNVSLLVKAFLETFKNKKNKPGLILKTSMVGSSYMDRDEILKAIKSIQKTVNSTDLPNIYVLHGEFTDIEMNEIYNHPKVKCMVSLTKGEGFGRPLLEFTQSKKPVLCSGWSGPLDFLNPEFTTLLQGALTPVHPSVANQWLLKEAGWFTPDNAQVGHYLKDIFENYKNYVDGGKRQGFYCKQNFTFNKMTEKLGEILNKIPIQVTPILPILPKLQKIESKPQLPKLNLPKIK